MAFFEDSDLILYDILLALIAGFISIMFIIGFVFYETERDYWTIFIWLISFFIGLIIGSYLPI